VRFLKHGKRSKLLDQIGEWSPQGWRSAPGPRVPKYLAERIERELQRRSRPPLQPLPPSQQKQRGCRVPGVTEAISCGRMPFPAFLAMELVEAYLPDLYRQHTAPGH
jgi:hypothetical protein